MKEEEGPAGYIEEMCPNARSFRKVWDYQKGRDRGTVEACLGGQG